MSIDMLRHSTARVDVNIVTSVGVEFTQEDMSAVSVTLIRVGALGWRIAEYFIDYHRHANRNAAWSGARSALHREHSLYSDLFVGKR